MARMAEQYCPLCDRDLLGAAEVYFENDLCVYASTRDPRDSPDVLPGCGIVVPLAHKPSPFDLTEAEWLATRELLLSAKAAWDQRLAPDGYVVGWNCAPEVSHAHLHVLPRFDDEPLAGTGLRFAMKHPDNRRPDPKAPGNGRARLFGP
jgi:diadenosine tetraphosphate (Ap4A) HIT family hydrolase